MPTPLVDGGVLNPVPIAPTFSDTTDLTIAVNLGGTIDPIGYAEIKPMEEEGLVFFQSGVKEFIQNLKLNSKIVPEQNWSMYQVADKSFDAMQSTIARTKLAAYPPDIEIKIPRNACGTLEFNRAKEMIKLGYNKAEEFSINK